MAQDWTDHEIYRLRELWDEGLSTAECGRRLGKSKNSVVGKAHRLDLPSRPSPIRRDSPRRHPGVRRPPRQKTTLPPLASVPLITEAQAQAHVMTAASPSPRPPAKPPALPLAQAKRPPSTAPTAPPPYWRIVDCCWPIGEPGVRDGPHRFRFCDQPSKPGKPYCDDHCAGAYRRIVDPREAAA